MLKWQNMPTIGIVFPTLNGWEDTKKCLESINKLKFSKDRIKVIVVYNGSTDGTIQKLQNSKLPKLQVIINNKNLGFAKAVNIGIRKSKGEYILITNNDVIFGSNSVSQSINYLINNPNTGVVGPEGLKYNFWLGRFKRFTKSDKPVEADWIAGHAMLFTKKLWSNLGGFDEQFFFTGEDTDFCLRAKKEGFKSIQVPRAKIIHKDGSTINNPKMAYFKYYEGYKSKFRLILRYGNFLQIISSFCLQIFLYTPYRGFVLKEKSTVPMIKALIWNLKKLSFAHTAKTP